MRHRLVPLLLATLLCGLVVACDGERGDRPAGPGTEDTTPEAPGGDSAPDDPEVTKPLTEEEARAASQARAARRDEVARGLLASHEARVYEPTRDSGLERLEGRIVAGVGDDSFEFTLDCRIDEEGKVLLDIERADASVTPPRDVAEMMVEIGRLSVKGASAVVLSRRPPIRYHSVKAPDGNYIVVAPPFQGDVQTSYRFDEEQTVTVVGHVSQAGKQVTRYEYDHYKGRYLLQRSFREGVGTETVFEHEEHSGVLLPERVTRTAGERTIVLKCEWQTIVASPPIR